MHTECYDRYDSRDSEIDVTVVDASSFPRRAYESSIERGFLINEVAEIGRAERKRRRSGFLRKNARNKDRRLFARITRVSAFGSQSHARPVNCRQLTRYTSRRRLTLLCQATSLSALFRIAAVFSLRRLVHPDEQR